ELTGAALRVERERLARARQLGEREPRRARGRLRLHPLEPLGERLELLLELLDLLPQGVDLLRRRRRPGQAHGRESRHECSYTHRESSMARRVAVADELGRTTVGSCVSA